MNLGELRFRCRTRANDLVKKYLWSDEEWDAGLNEAVNEASIRARLIEVEGVEIGDLSAGDPYVEIPEYMWSVTKVLAGGRKMILADKAMLDKSEGPRWEESVGDPIACYEIGGRLRFYPIPQGPLTVVAQAFCIPEKPMSGNSDTPVGIHSRLHEKLTDWALALAYSKPDADTFNTNLATKHEADFERVFGPRLDEKAMRRLRINVRRFVAGHYF